MKLSQKTRKVLSDFSSINDSILITPGSVLRSTRVPAMDVHATVPVDEVFDREIAIYNLKSFMNVLSMFSDPDIEWTPTHAIISQGSERVNFTLADARYIKVGPKQDLDLPPHACTFEMPDTLIKKVVKAYSTLSLDTMNVNVVDGVGKITVCDPKNMSKNSFVVDDVKAFGGDIKCSLAVNNASLLPTSSTYTFAVHELYVKVTTPDEACYVFPTNAVEDEPRVSELDDEVPF